MSSGFVFARYEQSQSMCSNRARFLQRPSHAAKTQRDGTGAKTRLPEYLTHIPDDTSIQNVVHYCQAILDDQFKAFDFGSASANLEKYNSTSPPTYGLVASANNLPTRIYWGGMDLLATPGNVGRILREITADPSVDDVTDVYLEDYNHLGFIWGVNAPSLVYADIINFFESH
ncbi:hypothetical protein Aperf_G00000001045 [Anoplocephala perfoliata]